PTDVPDAFAGHRGEALELVTLGTVGPIRARASLPRGRSGGRCGLRRGLRRGQGRILPRIAAARRRLRGWLGGVHATLRLLGRFDGLRRRDRLLANDGSRIAAGLDALEGRLADVAIAGPAAELRADHELRPDPGDPGKVAAPAPAPVSWWRRIERRRL